MFEKLGIPPKYKLIIIAVIVAIVLIIIILAYNAITRNSSEKKFEEISQLGNKVDDNKLSYQDVDYEKFAEKLKEAFVNSQTAAYFTPLGPSLGFLLDYADIGVGTDEEAVYEVFRAMKTRDDILKLINVYGTRDGVMLYKRISDELDNEELITLNSIIKKNNINFKFERI